MFKKVFLLMGLLIIMVCLLIFYTKYMDIIFQSNYNLKISFESKDSETLLNDLDSDINYMERQLSTKGEIEKEVDIYVDVEAFRANFKKKPKCRTITNPTKLWKKQELSTTNFTAESDFKRLTLAAQFIASVRSAISNSCGGLYYPEFLKAPPKEKLYPFEVSYLSERPVTDPTRISSQVYSTVRLLNTSFQFTVGDRVGLVVTMADRQGRRKLRGGDRIKVWLKDENFDNSISTKITDFDNGTYLAATILPWAGTLRVKAIMTFPREYLRAVVYSYRSLKCLFTHVGGYSNAQASEGVPCSALPLVPGHNTSELCNLTLVNGSPWYCGRPSNPLLNCSDFSLRRCVEKWREPILTKAETDLIHQQRNNQFKYLEGINQIKLTVQPQRPDVLRLEEPATVCNRVSPRATWYQTTPPGYFYREIWKSFLCQFPSKINPSCFKNIQILVIGDSNGRALYHSVRRRSGCKETISATYEKWQSELVCGTKADNFSVYYTPHSSPFGTTYDSYTRYSEIKSAAKMIDQIPPHGRYMVMLSIYLHLTTYHLSVFEEKMWSIRHALVRLFNRSTEAHVIIRGLHVTEFVTPYPKGDNLAPFAQAIMEKVFRDVQDRLVFFPTWDMTVASQDTDPHPKCNDQIAHLMLGFMCDRVAPQAV